MASPTPSSPAASPPASRGRAALAVLLLASTLTVMAGTILTPVVGVIRGELGVSGTGAGLILTAHGLSLAIASPLVGWTIDRWGLKTPLVAGLLLYGVAGGAGLVTTSYTALIISRFAFGVGAAAVFAGTTVALLALYEGPERDRVAGWRSVAISVGGIIWPLLGGALGGISWHGPFAIYLLGIPVGIAMMFTLPKSLNAKRPGGGGGTITLLRSRPRLLGLYALSLTSSFLLYVLAVFLPQRLAQLGVETPFLVALYTTSTSVAGTLVGLAYAKIKKSLGYIRLLRVSVVLWVAAFLVAGTAGNSVLIVLAPALFGLGMGMSVPALAVMIGETAPPALRGQATSLSGTANFTGQFAAPLVIGPAVGATSIATGFRIAGGIAALSFLLLFLLKDPAPAAAPSAAPKEPADEEGTAAR
ncbi:MFS transporter [Streptomyces roseifaciens]|uniref:MFS transporter n=1 Tax=Streptomyces roseifaciens TaxID=1488406 RepID=UPI00099F42AF|nr:MFS transporter [Streptomyces roseifaciens]